MADVASRPRTTDFAFMRRFNDDIDNSSTDNGDRSATAPDYSSLLAGSALYLDQRLNPGLSLGGNFDGTLQASQALLSSGNAGNLVPEITSATGAGTDEGPVSSEFQFPEMPAALLEQGPQYQYVSHNNRDSCPLTLRLTGRSISYIALAVCPYTDERLRGRTP